MNLGLVYKLLGRLILATILLNCSVASAQNIGVIPDYDSLIQQAATLRNQGDMPAAELKLRDAYEIANNKSEVAYLLGLIIAFQERYLEAIELIDVTLVSYPEDTNLLLAKARVLSYQGLLQEASDISAKVMLTEPANEDAQNLSARIALYQKRPDYAKQLFESLIDTNPNNLEAWIGLYDAEQAMGQNDNADQTLVRAASIDPQHPDVLTRQGTANLANVPRNSLVTGFERSKTDITSPDWNDRFIEYRRQYNRNTTQVFRLAHNHRFGFSDTSYETSVSLKQSSATPIELSISYTPNADFSAKSSARASTSFRVSEGNERIGTTVLSPSIQSSRYVSGSVRYLGLDLDHYLRNVDAWISVGAGTINDEKNINTTGWRVAAHWQRSARTLIGISHYQGAETENANTQQSSTNGVYISYRVSPVLQTRWDLNRSKRKNSYTRTNVSVSLQYRY